MDRLGLNPVIEHNPCQKMFTRSIFALSIGKFNPCSKDGFSLGSIYLARMLVCTTLKDKSGEVFLFFYFIILPHTMDYKQNKNDNK